MFSQNLFETIFNKTWLKRDPVFDVAIIFIHYKTINLDSISCENNKERNEKWLYIPHHLYRILIIGGSGSGKTNTVINLIREQDYNYVTEKRYLYAKDLNEVKYRFLIEKREYVGTKHKNDPTAYFECSNTVDDVYEKINYYNPKRDKEILIVFDDIIADIITNNKFQDIIKELFIRRRKVNISLVFITQSYFSVPKDVGLNSTQ